MEEIVSSPPVPNVKKRTAPGNDSPGRKLLNLKGSQFMMVTPPETDQSSNASPDVSVRNDEEGQQQEQQDRAVSPTPSSSALSSTIEVMPGSASVADNFAKVPMIDPGPPAKRRKLTPAEQLEKSKAKEMKERERAEEKARKEGERARREEEKAKAKEIKDEEKRARDEEKRKKAEEREARKREKELEEERKEQEKLKKSRGQMRLGAFFQQKPSTPVKTSHGDETHSTAEALSPPLEPYDSFTNGIKPTGSPAKDVSLLGSEKKAPTSKSSVSDYERTFLPFQLQTHCTMATIVGEESVAAQDAFDREINDPSLQQQYDLGLVLSYRGCAEIGHYFGTERAVQRGIPHLKMRELADIIQGTSQQPIDLTTGIDGPVELIRRIPVKHIQFEEDVRPAYCGTYTKIQSPKAIRKLRRNPHKRSRPDTNYDYDSEAEWMPPEEGDEELLSDEEDEADSVADANDDAFLDDEDDTTKNRRKMVTGELVPESTGLCWARENGRIGVVDSIVTDEQPKAMKGMRMGILLEGFSGMMMTIDPFSTSYWQDKIPGSNLGQISQLAAADTPAAPNSMAPPRVPLQTRLNVNGSPSGSLLGAAEGEKGPITSVAAMQGAKRGPKPAPKILSKEDMEEFKEAIVGSPLGKLDLQKGLKARFPKMTHDLIKETLSLQFAPVGKGKGEKRWVFVGNA